MTRSGLSEFKQLKPNTITKVLIEYIDKELQLFKSSSEFIDILNVKKNENQHSLSFCVFMTHRCKSKFYFARENAQSGSSVVDIGVYSGSNLIFTIEAKMLPTPSGTKANPRFEYEYVYGPGAGIQRFKECKHGLDNIGALLSNSGMLAFILEKEYKEWHTSVNGWIIDAKWPSSEKLKKLRKRKSELYQSKHTRSDNSTITLTHFWLKV
jgi:hypothetical protein